ncbi:POC1 centriolar protein A [Tulasnella sp. JGI-2019a]|nr:POC1 centriolar protein A [Tulasnella sp. JGI-2019a]KAG9032580.1 POC1 centriolar protein A [Tulasnella sp. JGI-2019a]
MRRIIPSSVVLTSAPSAQTTSGALYFHNPTRLSRFITGILRPAPPASSLSTGNISSELSGRTLTLLHDLKRFVMEFLDPIKASSMRIYYSTLPFTPTQTALPRVYTGDGLKVIRGVVGQWPQALWTATMHSDEIRCLAISPDGNNIVSGSRDGTLRMWDASTGVPIGEALHGHTSDVTCLAHCLRVP